MKIVLTCLFCLTIFCCTKTNVSSDSLKSKTNNISEIVKAPDSACAPYLEITNATQNITITKVVVTDLDGSNMQTYNQDINPGDAHIQLPFTATASLRKYKLVFSSTLSGSISIFVPLTGQTTLCTYFSNKSKFLFDWALTACGPNTLTLFDYTITCGG